MKRCGVFITVGKHTFGMPNKDVFGMDEDEMEGLGFTDGGPDWPEHDHDSNVDFFIEEIL